MTSTRVRNLVVAEPQQELAAFCRDLLPRLVGVLTLYVGDRDVAEDLAHDALVDAVARWPRLSRMARPEAYVTAAALNRARSRWRRAVAFRRAAGRHGPDERVHHDPDHAEILAVRDALAGLPEKQRRALLLRFHTGLSVAETADAMRCPTGTVTSLTTRAVAALRAELEIEPTSPDETASITAEPVDQEQPRA